VIAQAGKEPVGVSTRPVRAFIVPYVAVIVLANVGVDGARFAVGIVIVAGRDDKVYVPTVDQRGDVGLGLARLAIIAEHGHAHHRGWLGRLGQHQPRSHPHHQSPDTQPMVFFHAGII
jgi:hypothetical protein